MFRTKFRKNSSAFTVLKFVAAAAATGVAVAAFAAAPGLAVVARELLEAYEDRDRRAWLRQQQRMREAIRRLKQRRLVRYVERGGETFLVITKAGKAEVKKFEFEHLALAIPSRWDRQWRIVAFDIPEKCRQGRQVLRYKLRTLGFYPFQKSLFVYPYECRDEIDFVTHFCGVERYVAYFTASDLGPYEALTRKHFGLLLEEVR